MTEGDGSVFIIRFQANGQRQHGWRPELNKHINIFFLYWKRGANDNMAPRYTTDIIVGQASSEMEWLKEYSALGWLVFVVQHRHKVNAVPFPA